jgi:predicted extracellular nuclease
MAGKLKVASFNIEWMNHWFGPDSAPAAWKQKTQEGADVATTAKRAAAVIQSVDPDVLIDPWMTDIDGDGILNEYEFTRLPLVVDVTAGNESFKVIVLHTKSNFVNRGAQLWKDPATRPQYVREALLSRRRISAECQRVREYVDALLDADPDAKIAILGDMNDGPGRDVFERDYLTHSVTDITIGTAFEPEKQFAHAQHDVPAKERYSCVFDDFVANVKSRQVLLDHILLSPGLERRHGLRAVKGSGRVCHAEWEAEVVHGGQSRDDRPSDHRPVSVEFKS